MTANQIVDDMEARIRSGEYPPGTRLPSARDLAVLYGIGMSTANKVYLILKTKGLVVGVPGVGVYVAEDLSQ